MNYTAEVCPTDEMDMGGVALQRTFEKMMMHFMALRDWKIPYLTALPDMASSMGTR